MLQSPLEQLKMYLYLVFVTYNMIIYIFYVISFQIFPPNGVFLYGHAYGRMKKKSIYLDSFSEKYIAGIPKFFGIREINNIGLQKTPRDTYSTLLSSKCNNMYTGGAKMTEKSCFLIA